VKLDRLIRRLCENADSALDPMDESDHELMVIRDLTKKARTIQYADNPSAVFVGNTGWGTSELINNIIGSGEVCLWGWGGGGTITTYPMSLTFQRDLSEGQENCSAAVHLLSNDGISTTVSDAEEIDKRSRILQEDVEEYMQTCDASAKDTISLANLQHCMSDDSATHLRNFNCDDIKELVKKIQPYTYGTCSIVTEKIEVQLSAPRTFAGLQLGDTPGKHITLSMNCSALTAADTEKIDDSRRAAVKQAMRRNDIRLVCTTHLELSSRSAKVEGEVLATIEAVGRRKIYLILTWMHSGHDLDDADRLRLGYRLEIEQEPFISLAVFNAANKSEIKDLERQRHMIKNPEKFNDGADAPDIGAGLESLLDL
jgi:hypothetical protein